MMTFNQMKELFGRTKSVPAGNKNTAKSKIQTKKTQQPSSTNAEQKKVNLSAPPSRTKRRTCCGR